MERKQKNLISVLLLTVGVIFILVAGSIFVTTAWKYLPVLVKQMALLVVAAGMFGGSFLASRNEKLGWISQTLFHLGNAFIGFFMIAIMGGVIENNFEGNSVLQEDDQHFTDRERDIIKLVAQGYDNKEIATELYLAEGTVRNNISRVLEKLALKDRTQLAVYAVKHGLDE